MTDNKIDLKYISQMEKAINETYPDIALLVRDVNLSLEIENLYENGKIIREKAFVDASYRVGGMGTSHRYIIFSNHMANLSRMGTEANWGLCVANRNSHFKVLGKIKSTDKTAIVLLHLPDDEKWKFFEAAKLNIRYNEKFEKFKDLTFSIENRLFEEAKKEFEKMRLMPPFEELAKEDWLKRCEFPIGVSDDGEPFELE
ncbi:MAG: hypothetical protein IKD39_06865 [Oscillospiraceae bacterium]|nr:hypothetical protein [Oscillospiraceae bacterium]MBR3952217.1 hypothetical protein [Oscillospiraceae bacterium]